ncbi:MAG TPA: hypothetical protein VJB15_09825, partial [Rhodothermia bacterium]|nr:hypothetical protein [Rhodothermia bacterium]
VYACSRARGVTRTPIIVSRDGGQTWDDAGSGIPTQDVNRVAIAVTPANPNLLYAIFVGDDDGFAGFFRSTDSGVSWSLMSDKPHILSLRDGLTNTGNQGSYDLALAVSPTKPEQIYVGGINVWKSRDSGKNWDRKSVWNRGEPTNRFVHPDQHALAFFPGRADEIWACNDGGIYRSKNAGRTWEDRSNGLQITQVYTIATSRTSKTAVLSSQDNGVIVFDGSGFRQILGGDGFDSAFVEEDQKTILSAVFPIIVMRSTRLGKLTKEVTSSGQTIDGFSPTPRFAVDPVDAETVYLGVRRLFRSTRGGKERTWNKIKSFPDSTDDLTAVRIAPSNPQRLYVCRSNAMFTSADRGDTWTDVTMGLPTFGLTDIAVDPDNPSHVWVVASDSFSGQVFRSFNAGASWEVITGPLPPAAGSLPAFIINTIVRQSGNSNLVYVGTDVGVFLTHDGIAPNWVPYNSDLPTVVVQDLEIHPFTNTLFAATFGRGLWEAPLFIVPSFSIHLFPGALRLVRNGNGSVQVDIRRTPPSFKSTVALTIEGLPVGVTHNFHPQFGDTRTLDIAVGGSVAFGTYNARVIGNTGGIRSEAALTLTIKQFILSLSAPAVTIKGDDNQLKSAVVTVTINRSPGFSDSVQLSVAGLPVGSAQGEGISAGIDPVSTNGNTSTLRVSAGRFAPEQSLVLTISGSSGNFSDTIQLGVDVLPSSSSAPGGPVQP